MQLHSLILNKNSYFIAIALLNRSFIPLIFSTSQNRVAPIFNSAAGIAIDIKSVNSQKLSVISYQAYSGELKPIIKTFNCLLITILLCTSRVVWLDATVVPMLGMGFIKGAELCQLLSQLTQLR